MMFFFKSVEDFSIYKDINVTDEGTVVGYNSVSEH